MLIDGGVTHALVAERVCSAMRVHIPIFGMVKDDRHRTRALVTAEGREIDLHATPNVFALIGQIQEETHRFAITFHHESHTRSSTRSALDGIPGIGKVRTFRAWNVCCQKTRRQPYTFIFMKKRTGKRDDRRLPAACRSGGKGEKETQFLSSLPTIFEKTG